MPLELKSTLNLPRTSFSMKADLPRNEPKLLERWEEVHLYDRIREARKDRPVYVLHDGPPYANDAIHLGTALNKCVKDFVVKAKTMAGYDAPYVPGWDCHGLPIEFKVDKELGAKKTTMSASAFRQACREYAQRNLDIQRRQFKRIGVFGRWDRPYSTMTPDYEAVVIETFYAFLEQGLVYKGLKPVYWCIFDKTALAEAEVEYENQTSPSIWVKYRLISDPATMAPALSGKNVATVIWTTTPWTLPASMAVAFHPAEEYVALEASGETYIVAEKLARATAEKGRFASAVELARFPGRKLEHLRFAHPFLERAIPGVLGEYVTMDQGTGAVHTAPSHGADDFHTGAKYGIDQTTRVDEAGRMRHGHPQYEGLTVFEANAPILELLKQRGALLASEKIDHSYPHCWRCHNPVIFRATEQWFISMDTPTKGATLRDRALEEIKKAKWDPAWGEERITNMIATRPDWCISRQRLWGVPIAVFFCDGCGELLRSKEANKAVVEFFARAGADAWYEREPEEILPLSIVCPKCGDRRFRKEMDIIDVWFESGSSHAAVLGREERLPWPSDLYLEGGDQYRGWFHSSLLCAIGSHGGAPYRKVSTNGWTLDEEGRAMSKSLGNVVDPVDVADRLGGEIVRLWAASVDFREDVHASEALMQRMAESYRKIRNTFRFVLGNLHGFDPRSHAVAFSEMEGIDQYMLLRTSEMSERVREWYDQMAFHKVYHQLSDFCVVDLSALYFDVLKDRLYTFAPGVRARRSGQTAIWRIGEALVRLIAPLMSFTAEEVWQHLPEMPDRPESVHLALFPTAEEITGEPVLEKQYTALKADWEALLVVRSEVMKALEAARRDKLIGSGLEAQVVLAAPDPIHEVLERHRGELAALFIVSQVEVRPGGSGNGNVPVSVQVNRAAGEKCERCWNFSNRVGEDRTYPTVCERCSAALREIEKGVA